MTELEEYKKKVKEEAIKTGGDTEKVANFLKSIDIEPVLKPMKFEVEIIPANSRHASATVSDIHALIQDGKNRIHGNWGQSPFKGINVRKIDD